MDRLIFFSFKLIDRSGVFTASGSVMLGKTFAIMKVHFRP